MEYENKPFTCSGCCYFNEISETEGECRRNAPDTHVISYPQQGVGGIQLNVQVLAIWPKVTPAAWCGNWNNDFYGIRGKTSHFSSE